MSEESRTSEEGTVIDCDSCIVRGSACGDCVVSVLLGAPPEGVVLDPVEREALNVLATSGLVPPLRLVTAVDPSEPAVELSKRSERLSG